MKHLTKEILSNACADNDAECDGGVSVQDLLGRYGVDLVGAAHVSDQRALRLILQARGETPRPGKGYALSASERRMSELLQAAWVDGLSAALRALSKVD